MLTPAYTDLQIQFRMAVQQPESSPATTHEVRATIDGGGGWRGESTVDLAALGTLDGDPAAYGRRLGEMLLPQQVMSAFARARGVTDRPVRIRLLLEMGANGERQSQHFLRWERAMLALNGQTWPLAIAPALPFSRYIPTESVDPDLSGDSVLRLLVAFASPTGLPPELHPVDVESDLSALLDELTPLVRTKRFELTVLPGRTGVSGPLRDRLTELGAELLEGPTRKETIGDAPQSVPGAPPRRAWHLQRRDRPRRRAARGRQGRPCLCGRRRPERVGLAPGCVSSSCSRARAPRRLPVSRRLSASDRRWCGSACPRSWRCRTSCRWTMRGCSRRRSIDR